MCPRGALKRAVAAWDKHGLTPRVGIELEAYAFIRNEDGRIVPYDNAGGVVCGTGNFTDPRRLTDAIWAKAQETGLPPDLITAEYDTPQFEFTLTFDTAVEHVDTVVLFRQMAREVAWDHGILLSFLPKPITGKGGSGLHVNLSFTDGKDHNALTHGERGGNLSCATCHVYVADDWATRTGSAGDFEDPMLDVADAARKATSRLSCQLKMGPALDGIVLIVPQP